MSDLFDDRDEIESDEEDGADAIGGGGPARTLGDTAEMDDADFHGDRLAGGDPADRPRDDA